MANAPSTSMSCIILIIVISFIIIIAVSIKYIGSNSVKNDLLKSDFEDLIKNTIRTYSFEETYMLKRVVDQICYYDKSATLNKRRYKYFQTIIFILSAIVTLSPTINNFPNCKDIQIAPISGVGIMLITSFMGMNKFSHLMTEHRIVCENLKSLTIEFLNTKCSNEVFTNYVKNIENSINTETNKWANIATFTHVKETDVSKKK